MCAAGGPEKQAPEEHPPAAAASSKRFIVPRVNPEFATALGFWHSSSTHNEWFYE